MILCFRLRTFKNYELKTIHTTKCDISLSKQEWSSGKVAAQITDLKTHTSNGSYPKSEITSKLVEQFQNFQYLPFSTKNGKSTFKTAQRKFYSKREVDNAIIYL